MNFFDRLQQETAAERLSLLTVPLIRRCLDDGPFTREQYVAFLTEAFHHVRHTVPLLMAAGSRLPAEKESFRVAIAEYIEEETGHQEWILNDIQACGADPEAVRHGEPGAATELMVAYAYDTVMRRNPMGFFGMVLVLEGTSIHLATQAAAIIQRRLQLPNNAFSYLRSHGSLDIAHMQFFANLMNTIEDVRDQQAIVHAARRFYRLYGDIFRSIDAPAGMARAA
jgi:pyrroloquinoline quinone (PQQ) biosynthesis protein C